MAYYVYLLAGRKDGPLYLGVTKDLIRRVLSIGPRRSLASPRATTSKLVWFEIYDDPISAISREEEIKKWRRAWKIALIARENRDWKDLYDDITR